MARNLYLDLGANHGVTIQEFRKDNPDFFVFGFEPTPRLAEKLRKAHADTLSQTHIMEYAVWIADGVLDFYMGKESDHSSTLLKDKKTVPVWEVDYDRPVKVQSIDFDRWLRENTSDHDHIVMKMDIEGAEYKVLRRMIDTGSIKRINEARVEWHWDRYPGEISKAEHEAVRERVASLTKLVDWV